MKKLCLLGVAAGLFLIGCATVPTGPNVMVLPSQGKDFEQFQYEDGMCRQWAAQQIGVSTNQAATNAAVSSAAIGTVLGGAAGAAVGAAYGNPAMGAAVGAGLGLVGGSAAGANNAAQTEYTLQQRYDMSYIQCMYAKGNQVPMPAGYRRPQTAQRPPPPPGNMPPPPGNIPPPPAGSPPPPPPG